MRLLVVGASLAGLRAVEAARKSGFDGPITLVGAEPHLPYDRPPLSKAVLDGADLDAFRTEETLRSDLGVDLRLGEAATALDTAARTVTVGDELLVYDALVIATGATARTLPGNLRGLHTLRTRDDALAVREALDAGARVVVVGAGFIGSEVASAARKRGLDVTIVEALPTPLVRSIGLELGEICSELHERHGTRVLCRVGVEAVEGDDAVRAVRLTDGTVLPADLVVAGIGAVPATDWLAGSGLKLDDGVVCDATLWTGAEGVYAAGDVARWHNPLLERSMRLEHWTSAAEQAAVAARNALDPENAKPYATVPYFWSDWYDTRIQFVGVPTADEIRVVRDAPRLVALYREKGRLVGALTFNGQNVIMKYRAMIMKRAAWDEALARAL